jgi:hypothetical protein
MSRLTLTGAGGGPPPAAATPLIFEVDTRNTGTSDDDQFTMPTTGSYDVDWGDSSTESISSAAPTHTYASEGVYDITISNVSAPFDPLKFANGGDKAKLTDIKQWGNQDLWTSSGFSTAFWSCTNLDISATDIPDTSAVTSFYFAFYNCTSLTSTNEFVTDDVTNMGYAFSSCTSLTTGPTLSTGSVTDFEKMFRGCTSLTSVPAYDLTNATVVTDMFANCTAITSFPADLLSSAPSNLTNMSNMFNNCESVTSFPSEWNFSVATNISAIFGDCTALTSLPSGWDFDNVTNPSNMVRFCTSLTSFPAYTFAAATTYSFLLYGCSGISTLPNFPNSDQVTDFSYAFGGMGSINMPSSYGGTDELDMSNMTDGSGCFSGSTLPTTGTQGYNDLLVWLEGYNGNSSVTFHGGSSTYSGTLATNARADLIADHSWSITDGTGPNP